MALNINQLWQVKTEKLSDKLMDIVRGDKDLYQEGIIGIREGLMRNPHATDAYLISAAKWAISHYKNRGVSMDNGTKCQYTKKLADGTIKQYRKDTMPIYIDALLDEFDMVFPEYSYSPDIRAIDRVCAEKFYTSLDENEAIFIEACIKTMDNYFYGSRVKRRLHIGCKRYNDIKQSVYQKFIHAFGTDDEIVSLP